MALSRPDVQDPFDLARFERAQAADYAAALAEIRAGAKRSHWIWYVFPQLRGLGASPASHLYGLTGLAEARAYLAHPVLGMRLRECVQALLAVPGGDAARVLGPVDAMKLHASLTLFQAAAPQEPLWAEAQARYFAGAAEPRTLAMLAAGGL